MSLQSPGGQLSMDIFWVPVLVLTHDIQDLTGPLLLTAWHYEILWNLDTSPGKRGS